MPHQKVKAPRGERGAFGRPEGRRWAVRLLGDSAWIERYGRVWPDTSNRLQQDVPLCAGLDRQLPHEIRIQYCAVQ